jgi:biopolymer transport protein ExbD
MRIARKPKRRNTIVLTSLVDVMFVLLFFFMLVTQYGDWHSWSMALAGGGDEAENGALIVQVMGDGALLLDTQPASFESIAQRLQQRGARALLVAGPGVSLQAMVDALDRLKPTGAALTLGRAADAQP